jgi:signal transduction histidine kinase
MTVRRYVALLIAACIVTVVAMAGIMAVSLWLSDHMGRRVAAIHDRLDVLSQLSATAGHYGEQAAELLLFGREPSEGLEPTRIDMERLLARLTQATRAEISTLSDMEEVQSALPQLEGARRIIELYHSIDAALNNVLSLGRLGQKDSAVGVFQRQVAFRLVNELQPLLATAADDERSEAEAEIAKLATREQPLFVAAGVVAVAALLAIAALAIGLSRAVGAALSAERRRSSEAGEKLSSEVDARTAQLRAANEQLREIDRRRGQFLADVSHELRTPLTILRGEADVALRGEDDPGQQRQSLERIQGQAAELSHLLEDLLEFARSAAEDQPYVMADTQLDEVVTAAAQEAQTLAAPREVTVRLQLGDQGRHLDADFRRLKQALIIGLDNAIKHSPPGTGVTIATAMEGPHAKVSILDEGAGLDEADLPRVFERFYRGQDEEDTLVSGLGIGLAIAKDIVERHGGSISLSNRPEGGAALAILLPVEHQTN